MRAVVSLCAGIAVAAACASSPAQPRAVDPVGTFDFSTSMEGTEVTGSIEISSGANGYTGWLTTNVSEPIPIASVMVEGQVVTVIANAPDGPVNFSMTFTGDEFSGGWTYAGMSGQATGRRRTTDD
jgi:hypothetical protein